MLNLVSDVERALIRRGAELSEEKVHSVRHVLMGILMELGENPVRNRDDQEDKPKIPESQLAPLKEKLSRLIELIQHRGRSMREYMSENSGIPIENYSSQKEALDAVQILSTDDLQVAIKAGMVETMGFFDAGELDFKAKSALIRTADGQIHSVTLTSDNTELRVNLSEQESIRFR